MNDTTVTPSSPPTTMYPTPPPPRIPLRVFNQSLTGPFFPSPRKFRLVLCFPSLSYRRPSTNVPVTDLTLYNFPYVLRPTYGRYPSQTTGTYGPSPSTRNRTPVVLSNFPDSVLPPNIKSFSGVTDFRVVMQMRRHGTHDWKVLSQGKEVQGSRVTTKNVIYRIKTLLGSVCLFNVYTMFLER